MESNLLQPVLFTDRTASPLTANEREAVIRDYARTLDAVRRAADRNPAARNLSDFLADFAQDKTGSGT